MMSIRASTWTIALLIPALNFVLDVAAISQQSTCLDDSTQCMTSPLDAAQGRALLQKLSVQAKVPAAKAPIAQKSNEQSGDNGNDNGDGGVHIHVHVHHDAKKSSSEESDGDTSNGAVEESANEFEDQEANVNNDVVSDATEENNDSEISKGNNVNDNADSNNNNNNNNNNAANNDNNDNTNHNAANNNDDNANNDDSNNGDNDKESKENNDDKVEVVNDDGAENNAEKEPEPLLEEDKNDNNDIIAEGDDEDDDATDNGKDEDNVVEQSKGKSNKSTKNRNKHNDESDDKAEEKTVTNDDSHDNDSDVEHSTNDDKVNDNSDNNDVIADTEDSNVINNGSNDDNSGSNSGEEDNNDNSKDSSDDINDEDNNANDGDDNDSSNTSNDDNNESDKDDLDEIHIHIHRHGGENDNNDGSGDNKNLHVRKDEGKFINDVEAMVDNTLADEAYPGDYDDSVQMGTSEFTTLVSKSVRKNLEEQVKQPAVMSKDTHHADAQETRKKDDDKLSKHNSKGNAGETETSKNPHASLSKRSLAIAKGAESIKSENKGKDNIKVGAPQREGKSQSSARDSKAKNLKNQAVRSSKASHGMAKGVESLIAENSQKVEAKAGLKSAHSPRSGSILRKSDSADRSGGKDLLMNLASNGKSKDRGNDEIAKLVSEMHSSKLRIRNELDALKGGFDDIYGKIEAAGNGAAATKPMANRSDNTVGSIKGEAKASMKATETAESDHEKNDEEMLKIVSKIDASKSTIEKELESFRVGLGRLAGKMKEAQELRSKDTPPSSARKNKKEDDANGAQDPHLAIEKELASLKDGLEDISDKWQESKTSQGRTTPSEDMSSKVKRTEKSHKKAAVPVGEDHDTINGVSEHKNKDLFSVAPKADESNHKIEKELKSLKDGLDDILYEVETEANDSENDPAAFRAQNIADKLSKAGKNLDMARIQKELKPLREGLDDVSQMIQRITRKVAAVADNADYLEDVDDFINKDISASTEESKKRQASISKKFFQAFARSIGDLKRVRSSVRKVYEDVKMLEKNLRA